MKCFMCGSLEAKSREVAPYRRLVHCDDCHGGWESWLERQTSYQTAKDVFASVIFHLANQWCKQGTTGWPPVDTEDATPEDARDILSLADRDIPLEVVSGWTEEGRKQAVDWASAVILVASDNEGIEIPHEPEWVQVYDPRRT